MNPAKGRSRMGVLDRDVRRVAWGMDRDAVQEAETEILIGGNEDALLYQTRLIDSDCVLMYKFTEGELSSAMYVFDNIDDSIDVHDFLQLKEMLEGKYGPAEATPFWKNPQKRTEIEDASDIAAAVAAGLLVVHCSWSTPRTEITLSLDEDPEQYNVKVLVLYKSSAHIDLERDLREQSDLDML